MGTVVSVLPPPDDAVRLSVAVAAVLDQFAPANAIQWMAMQGCDPDSYAGVLDTDIDVAPHTMTGLAKYAALVMPTELSERVHGSIHRQVFLLEPNGVLRPLVPWLSSVASPQFDQHVFGRMGERMGAGLRYFPYGFFTQNPGLGAQDAFGHRTAVSIPELERRESGHRVVAVFGGSAAYGHNVPRARSFPGQLQSQLDAALGAGKVTVLNLAQEAALVLNQSISFTLFCHRLQPDIVVSHDGWNDLLNGAITDPFLLCQHQMSYVLTLETWGRSLQRAEHVSESQVRETYEPNSPVHAVVEAYISRKQFFREMVVANGGQFIAGLQPGAFHKAALTGSEKRNVERAAAQVPALRDVRDRRLPLIYDYARHAHAETFGDCAVDFPALMQAADVTVEMFADAVHLTGDGERFVARAYADRLIPILRGIEEES